MPSIWVAFVTWPNIGVAWLLKEATDSTHGTSLYTSIYEDGGHGPPSHCGCGRGACFASNVPRSKGGRGISQDLWLSSEIPLVPRRTEEGEGDAKMVILYRNQQAHKASWRTQVINVVDGRQTSTSAFLCIARPSPRDSSLFETYVQSFFQKALVWVKCFLNDVRLGFACLRYPIF